MIFFYLLTLTFHLPLSLVCLSVYLSLFLFLSIYLSFSTYLFLSCTVNCLNKKEKKHCCFFLHKIFFHTYTHTQTNSFFSRSSISTSTMFTRTCVCVHIVHRTRIRSQLAHTRDIRTYTRRKFDQLQPHDLSRKFKEVDRH